MIPRGDVPPVLGQLTVLLCCTLEVPETKLIEGVRSYVGT